MEELNILFNTVFFFLSFRRATSFEEKKIWLLCSRIKIFWSRLFFITSVFRMSIFYKQIATREHLSGEFRKISSGYNKLFLFRSLYVETMATTIVTKKISCRYLYYVCYNTGNSYLLNWKKWLLKYNHYFCS